MKKTKFKKEVLNITYRPDTCLNLGEEENDEIPGWKAGKFVAYCVPCSKEAFDEGTQRSTNTCCRRRRWFRSFWSKASIFTVSFTNERALIWALACLLYMHESSLLTYLHIPSVFHNQLQRLCNGYFELYSGRNIDFTLKNHCQTRPLFYSFGVAVRFDWIKIDVCFKLCVLNYSSRPKLSSGSAHVKYDVWPDPHFQVFNSS